MHLTASLLILTETEQGGRSWEGVETCMSHHALFSKAPLGSPPLPPQLCLQKCQGCLLCPQVTLLSFSVDSEFTFVDYIKGG